MEAWKQSRQTKLGLVTIEIEQIQDLFEATVSLVNATASLIFDATETFGDVRTAFLWAYGLKQSVNDDWSAYKRVEDNLIETKPPKGALPKIYDIEAVIESVKADYANFELGRTSTSKGNTISVSEVKSSTLSSEDQAKLLELMAKVKAKTEMVNNG